MILGSKFKKVRKNLGFSAKEMAESLGINRGTLIHYENDDRTPSIDLTLEFIKKYNVDPGWFLFDENPESNVNKPLVIQDIYPGVPDDSDVDELLKCLQVPIIYHAVIYNFIILKKKYDPFITAFFENETMEKTNAYT